MLQIRNLTIIHKKDMRELITGLTVSLNSGDKIAIIGEEGNGKSTLLKLIYDENLVENYVDYTGEIIDDNMRKGYVEQELAEEICHQTVYEYMLHSSSFTERTPKELAHVCGQLGVSHEILFSDQKMGSLSGGEKVKLQLARILLEEPDVLLLDEPSNDIDIHTLCWLERFILQCKLPILYISHDEVLLEKTANKVIHIEQIRRKTKSRVSVEKIGYTEYVEKRMLGFEHQDKMAKKERSELQKQMEKYQRLQQKIERQQNTVSRQDPHTGAALKRKMHTVKSMGKRFEKAAEDMTELPDMEKSIVVRFQETSKIHATRHIVHYHQPHLQIGDRRLADNIELDVIGPQKVAIIGDNGRGKSTMLKEIWRTLQQDTKLRTFYMPQNYEERLDYQKTPIEYMTKKGDREENVKICTFLGSMKYTADEMQHPIGELSGGQKAKLIFLSMTMEPWDVLLLDEPTRNFSPLSNPIIRDMLADFQGAIISVSHDRKYITEVCDIVYTLTENGLDKQKIQW